MGARVKPVAVSGRMLTAVKGSRLPMRPTVCLHACPQEEVPAENVGKFFSGDSYVVHYSYNKGGAWAHIIYFWLGKNSAPIEQGSAAARTKELSDSLVRPACRSRVSHAPCRACLCSLL